MIQVGTVLNVIDNTGAKTARCLKVFPGYKRRYANLGDIILVSVKSFRSKRRDLLKIKKGELYYALILRTRCPKYVFSGDSFFYLENPAIILLTKQNKIVGSRIFGGLSKSFRYTKFLKVLSLSSGISFF
jgi:large subunit ribosomal protein L14